ncbi:hypothetical protein KIN20_032932 [Parelaphostrongylus tenuis]|uniref:Uncharacterized protein n=1 Tax=Parelaphostrongylus tenuis TaxID=148309 RepID=A0AAD5WID7_PARTN|nr:hypothetical protein KIN20_032932 [Parelaphostrongylus tenuis]
MRSSACGSSLKFPLRKSLNVIATRSRTFDVTGLTTLPVAMAYSTAPDVHAQVPGIASREGGAQASIFDVLESQDRSALLPDGVISANLGQLEVRMTYVPLQCQMFISDSTEDRGRFLILNILWKN